MHSGQCIPSRTFCDAPLFVNDRIKVKPIRQHGGASCEIYTQLCVRATAFRPLTGEVKDIDQCFSLRSTHKPPQTMVQTEKTPPG